MSSAISQAAAHLLATIGPVSGATAGTDDKSSNASAGGTTCRSLDTHKQDKHDVASEVYQEQAMDQEEDQLEEQQQQQQLKRRRVGARGACEAQVCQELSAEEQWLLVELLRQVQHHTAHEPQQQTRQAEQQQTTQAQQQQAIQADRQQATQSQQQQATRSEQPRSTQSGQQQEDVHAAVQPQSEQQVLQDDGSGKQTGQSVAPWQCSQQVHEQQAVLQIDDEIHYNQQEQEQQHHHEQQQQQQQQREQQQQWQHGQQHHCEQQQERQQQQQQQLQHEQQKQQTGDRTTPSEYAQSTRTPQASYYPALDNHNQQHSMRLLQQHEHEEAPADERIATSSDGHNDNVPVILLQSLDSSWEQRQLTCQRDLVKACVQAAAQAVACTAHGSHCTEGKLPVPVYTTDAAAVAVGESAVASAVAAAASGALVQLARSAAVQLARSNRQQDNGSRRDAVPLAMDDNDHHNGSRVQELPHDELGCADSVTRLLAGMTPLQLTRVLYVLARQYPQAVQQLLLQRLKPVAIQLLTEKLEEADACMDGADIPLPSSNEDTVLGAACAAGMDASANGELGAADSSNGSSSRGMLRDTVVLSEQREVGSGSVMYRSREDFYTTVYGAVDCGADVILQMLLQGRTKLASAVANMITKYVLA